MSPGSDITVLLNRVAAGDRAAEDELIPHIYADLKVLAGRYLRMERATHTLQTTALVHEAYLRLIHGAQPEWQNRAHFFATAARVMRRILVDHARKRHAGKRGGDAVLLSLEEGAVFDTSQPAMVLALNDALERLEQLDPRQARIVEMRFFGGMTEDEISECLGISPRTVKRDWAVAKAWLYGELAP